MGTAIDFAAKLVEIIKGTKEKGRITEKKYCIRRIIIYGQIRENQLV